MLQIDSLTKIFYRGSVNEVTALNGINLHLPGNQFVTLIGSNGSGKTTLFNCIAGVYPPTSGKILIDGIDVTGWSEHRRAAFIGRVFQDPLLGTADTMTIAENLTLALLRSQSLKLRTGVTRDRRRFFQSMLEPLMLDLEHRLDTRVALLSGGQRQALTLLMASLTQPKILLLDEHTAALDPTTAKRIIEITHKIIAERQITTLMITHNMRLALEYGDRMLMLDRGEIVLDLDSRQKTGMTIEALLAKFARVRGEPIQDDELLLTAD